MRTAKKKEKVSLHVQLFSRLFFPPSCSINKNVQALTWRSALSPFESQLNPSNIHQACIAVGIKKTLMSSPIRQPHLSLNKREPRTQTQSSGYLRTRLLAVAKKKDRTFCDDMMQQSGSFQFQRAIFAIFITDNIVLFRARKSGYMS